MTLGASLCLIAAGAVAANDLQQADERALSYLTERPALDRLADDLLEREELEGSELERLLREADSAAEPVHH